MPAVRIDEEHLKKLHSQAEKQGMKNKEYLESMVEYFEKNNISPKSYTSNDALRSTFVSFIREQEKKFLVPMKNDVSLLNDNYQELKDTLSFILEILKK